MRIFVKCVRLVCRFRHGGSRICIVLGAYVRKFVWGHFDIRSSYILPWDSRHRDNKITKWSQLKGAISPVDRTLREMVIPDFDGDAYLELPTLDNVGMSFALEIWFLTRSPDGVLLYNGQMGGGGDFIALNLRNGHLEFSYNLGSGLATLVWVDGNLCLVMVFFVSLLLCFLFRLLESPPPPPLRLPSPAFPSLPPLHQWIVCIGYFEMQCSFI